MRASKHTAICMIIVSVALFSGMILNPGKSCVSTVTAPASASLQVVREDDRPEKIRTAIRTLAEKHRAPFERDRLRLLADAIYQESLDQELDPLLVAAIISMESSFRPAVVSDAGAVGLMQLRPFVARDVAERNQLLWDEEITLVEPRQNIRLGVRYYRELVDRFQGDERLALIAYNRGPTRLSAQLRAAEGDIGCSYAERVLRLYRELCEDCGLLQA